MDDEGSLDFGWMDIPNTMRMRMDDHEKTERKNKVF